MARLVQGREQRLLDVAIAHAGGDTHVVDRELGAEWVVRLVEPAALEAVAEAFGDAQAEVELCRLAEDAAQAAIVGRRLRGDGAHHRHEVTLELAEQCAHRGRGHALVSVVDKWVGDVRVGREEAGVFAADIEGLFQEWRHGGEVVRRPRPRPGIVGCRAERVGARHVFGRHLDRLLEVPARHADERRVVVVVGQSPRICRERVEELAKLRVHRFFVREPVQRRALAPARLRAALRHVGGLIP